jgi:hypothetical protein
VRELSAPSGGRGISASFNREEPTDGRVNSHRCYRPTTPALIDDMNMRRFSRETQRNYIRDAGRFATFLGRSPDTATARDMRRFQIERRDADADHEQHCVGVAVLLHAHDRPA